MTLANISALVAASAVGAMTFFSFVVAPLVFARLPKDVASEFMRAAFPVYYAVLAAVAVAAAVSAALHPAAILLWGVVVLFLGLRFWLLPTLEKVRGGDRQAFRTLHRISVAVNGLQMFLLAAAALWLSG